MAKKNEIISAGNLQHAVDAIKAAILQSQARAPLPESASS